MRMFSACCTLNRRKVVNANPMTAATNTMAASVKSGEASEGPATAARSTRTNGPINAAAAKITGP